MGINVTDVGLEKKSEIRELKKHAATIHCSNSLSLLQRKVSNALLYHAYKELMTKEEHEITIKQLCKLISYNGNNHAVIKSALKGLISTVIEWNVVNDTTGVEDWTASSILASVSLQGPLCLYAYSPRMKQLLHSPSMFGKVNLVIQSRFKSNYGLALYENCTRYRGLPYTKWFDIETFRKLMGVPDGKYEVFRDFKKRVLDKSIEEVNTYSDLIIVPEIAREGRQVVKVRFSLQEREKKVRLGGTKKSSDESASVTVEGLKTKLIEHYGLSTEQAQAILNEFASDFILEKMSLIESSRNYQQGKVHNLAGYLLSALKNNFQAAKGAKEDMSQLDSSSKGRSVEFGQLRRVVEQLREDYSAYREQTIDEAVQVLPDAESFIERFMLYAASPITTVLQLQKNKYTKETILQSPQIKALLRQFALDQYPAIKQSLLSLEIYIDGLAEDKRLAWRQFQLLSPESHLLQPVDIEAD